MEYSKPELAKICGVSTQAIDKRLKATGLRAQCIKVSNRLLIPETVATEIATCYGVELKPGFKPIETETTRFQTNETSEPKPAYIPMEVYEDLRKQLEIKDRQIADLSAALVNAQESLKAEQLLHATEKKELLLKAGETDPKPKQDETVSIPEEKPEENEPKERKNLWQRLVEAWRG